MSLSRSLISNHSLESRPNVIIFAVTIVINKSHNLVGALGSLEFGPKIGSLVQRNSISLC